MASDAARPRLNVPPGATDCHSHVIGPVARWPMVADRRYTPEENPVERYRAVMAALGLSRCVLVQPSVYGTDNGCQLEAMRTIGLDRCRGIAVIEPDIAERDLAALHEGGMRGVRFNLNSGGLGVGAIETVAARIAPLGWHVQIFTTAPIIAELAPRLRRLPVAVVIDHMGQFAVEQGPEQPGFQALLGLLRDGKAWVKISGPERVSRQAGDYDDVVPYARALIAAAPERCVWGLDWPPSRFLEGAHGDAAMLDQLLKYTTDDRQLQAILVDNPARLYGF